MPIYTTAAGVQRELTAVSSAVSGVQRELELVNAAAAGVQREIFAAGFRWERYAVAQMVQVTEETGTVSGIANGESCYYYSGTKTESEILSVYTNSEGSFVRLAGTGYRNKTATVTMAELSGNLSGLWFEQKPTVISRYDVYAEHAYFGNGQYVTANNKTGEENGIGYSKIASVVQTKGDLIDIVIDPDENAYPENGEQGGYWYVKR